MNLASDLIKDCNGKLSMRKLMFGLWCFVVLGVWVWLSVTTGVMVNLPSEIKWVIGLLAGTYVAGNYVEQKSDPLKPSN